MKKNYIFGLLLICLFSACHKDEIYQPACKLTSVENADGSVCLSLLYDGKLPQKAIFSDEELFVFEYNSDKTVQAIYNYLEDSLYSFVTMTYDHKHLSQIDYFLLINKDSVLTQQKKFFRNEETLYGVKTYASSEKYFVNKKLIEKCRLFHAFFPIIEDNCYAENLGKGSLLLLYQTNVIFSKDNVVKLITTYNNGFEFSNIMTYDEGNSPFYGLPFAFTDLFSIPFDVMSNYSKNNIVTYSYTENSMFFSDKIYHYFYQYNKKNYPIDLFRIDGEDTTLIRHFNYDK